ncbi:MAG: arylesterase [Gammaproteobacteria bacterium]|nr:arylesterase [Gammaproteobacteria bacterium]
MRILLLVWLAIVGFPACASGSATLLVLGDSLSAAYGISPESGWVALLARRLLIRPRPLTVVNASVSGDTTRSALARLPDALARHRPEVVVVELGGNDGLRGLSLEEFGRNLREIVTRAQASAARVLIVPVRMPPNYGPVYTDRFAAVFGDVAAATGAAISTPILSGVAENPELMQDDGLHPRSSEQARMLDNVWPALEPLL